MLLLDWIYSSRLSIETLRF